MSAQNFTYLTLSGGVDQGKMLVVESADAEVFSVDSDGLVAFSGGSQAASIADVPTAGSADAADNATAINGILAALRTVGILAEPE